MKYLKGPTRPSRRATWIERAFALVGLSREHGGIAESANSHHLTNPKDQLRRRRVTVSVLAVGTAAAVSLVAFAPLVGLPLTALFVVALGFDIGLLAQRQRHAAERAMTTAFRSRPGRTTPSTTHPVLGPHLDGLVRKR